MTLADVFDQATRSRVMSRIRGRDTGPEILLRSRLHAAGFRFRVNCRTLPGTPDIANRRRRIAIFVHGCFWHQHTGCPYAVRPKSNTQYWLPKLEETRKRDLAALAALTQIGFRVATVWECAVRPKRIDETCRQLVQWLSGDAPNLEL